MAKINLLPWRDKLRDRLKKEFFEASGFAVAVGIFLLVVWGTMIGLKIDNQVARNDVLKAEIEKLDKEIEEVNSLEKKRDVLVSRMKIISGLQADRPFIVHIFDELVRTLPEGVYYKSINRTPGRITINGVADSNDSVSALMRKLEASAWLKSPLLSGVTNQKITVDTKSKDGAPKQNISTFNLTVSEDTPNSGAADKQGSAK